MVGTTDDSSGPGPTRGRTEDETERTQGRKGRQGAARCTREFEKESDVVRTSQGPPPRAGL